MFDLIQNINTQLQTNLERLKDLKGDMKITVEYDTYISDDIEDIIEKEEKIIQDVAQLQTKINELFDKIQKMNDESELFLQNIKKESENKNSKNKK